MAHHKSAKKRIKTSEKRRKINKDTASKLKTMMKKVKSQTEKAQAEGVLKEAISLIDKTVCKGRLNKNTAARRKSSLTKFVNGLK